MFIWSFAPLYLPGALFTCSFMIFTVRLEWSLSMKVIEVTGRSISCKGGHLMDWDFGGEGSTSEASPACSRHARDCFLLNWTLGLDDPDLEAHATQQLLLTGHTTDS